MPQPPVQLVQTHENAAHHFFEKNNIDETLWSELFNRDPQVIGRALTINDTAATIVGVMAKTAAPPDMTGLQDLAQIWAPMGRFFPPARCVREARRSSRR